MRDALIGYTGFVGGTLLAQGKFDQLYRSTNVHEVAGQSFDTVYCAGAPGKKWLANKEPQQDAASIDKLCAALAQLRCKRLVLLSTVDVFAKPQGVTETSAVGDNPQAYGKNRRRLEVFVQEHFAQHLIARLPALVGAGLRKNALYDLAHARLLDALRADAVFQFYPMDNLYADLHKAMAAKLSVVHLAAEPTPLSLFAQPIFGIELASGLPADAPPPYDMHSLHAELWGSQGPYPYDAQQVQRAVRAYAADVRASRQTHAPSPQPAQEQRL